MKLEFDITEEDFAAFAEYYYRHSPEGRRSMFRIYLIGAVLFIAFGVLEYDHESYGIHNPPMYALYLAVSALILGGVFLVYLRIIRPAIVRWMSRTSTMRDMLGPTRFHYDDSHVYVENAAGRGKMPWERVRAVGEGPEHLFVVIGPLRAFIIPKRALEGEAASKALLADLRNRHQGSHAAHA